MPQKFQQTEGIILRVIPFRDHDQIISLFTLDAGLLKLHHKRSRAQWQKIQGFCMPLTKVEVTYREKKGEIFDCQEMGLVDSFSILRKEWTYLNVGCDMLQAIATSQLTGKAAPQLYTLLCFYLKKISQTIDPWILAVSFRLKLLRHDGLIHLPFRCSECQQLLHTFAYTYDSEGWCIHHQPMNSRLWEQQELQQLYRLAMCHSYQEIYTEFVSSQFQAKVSHFFERCIKR